MSILLQQHLVPNTGSNARDFCMLERNLLSHLKLALLLSLLASSLLLRARLVPEPERPPASDGDYKAGLPLACVEMAAALAAIVGGIWEYQSGYKDLRDMRAFLVAADVHLVIMGVVVAAVFATCIVLVVDGA